MTYQSAHARQHCLVDRLTVVSNYAYDSTHIGLKRQLLLVIQRFERLVILSNTVEAVQKQLQDRLARLAGKGARQKHLQITQITQISISIWENDRYVNWFELPIHSEMKCHND